jgi:hypothetical protein
VLSVSVRRPCGDKGCKATASVCYSLAAHEGQFRGGRRCPFLQLGSPRRLCAPQFQSGKSAHVRGIGVGSACLWPLGGLGRGSGAGMSSTGTAGSTTTGTRSTLSGNSSGTAGGGPNMSSGSRGTASTSR